MTPGIQELMREVERVRDGFRRAVLAGDADAAVALCADGVTLVDLPVGTGAAGREAVRGHFQWALARGYQVTALQRDPVATRSFYLLQREASI